MCAGRSAIAVSWPRWPGRSWRRVWGATSGSPTSARGGRGSCATTWPGSRTCRCLDRGQLQVTDIAGMPASDPATDPVDELIDLAAMTRDALDAGYTGLRIVANGTLRVIDPRRRDRIVHFEHLIDRVCLDHAFTRLCAFDATALGADLLAELGCVHTLTHGQLSPF